MLCAVLPVVVLTGNCETVVLSTPRRRSAGAQCSSCEVPSQMPLQDRIHEHADKFLDLMASDDAIFYFCGLKRMYSSVLEMLEVRSAEGWHTLGTPLRCNSSCSLLYGLSSLQYVRNQVLMAAVQAGHSLPLACLKAAVSTSVEKQLQGSNFHRSQLQVPACSIAHAVAARCPLALGQNRERWWV